MGEGNDILLCTGRGSVARRGVLTFLMDSSLFCYVNVLCITISVFQCRKMMYSREIFFFVHEFKINNLYTRIHLEVSICVFISDMKIFT